MGRPLALLALLLAGSGLCPGEPLKVSLQRLPAAAAMADGVIGGDEYSFRKTDPATGIEVMASADSATLHIALKSPGSGWVALGLGSSGMNGAVIVIARAAGGGKWSVEQHLGKSLYRHSPVDKPNLISKAAWQEDGRTCMEFSIPLRFSGAKALAPGTPMPFILAYHKDRGTLSKHTRKSSGSIVLAR